jgi:hypothetical protein
MDMQRLTRDEIINAFGHLDDGVVAQVIASGATLRDLTEARAWLESNEPLMNDGRPLAGGAVARLVEIMGKIEEEHDPAAR